jgi:type I restriction enzyme S subunit
MSVVLPPVEEQRRIAAILDQAETLRAKRRQALAKLDTLTQSLFLEMFGDPFGNPNKWESATLAQVMTSGPQNGLYKPSTLYGSGTPILRIDAFYDGEISDPTQLKRVSLTEPEIALYLLRDNDIVVNRVNSREYLGKSALVVGLSEPTVFESNMMRFHVDESRVESRYLIALLQTRYIKKQIMQRCKDAVNQSSINQDDVKSFVIRIPPIDLQTTFAVRLECLRGNLRSQIKSLGRVDILTQSLQHRAFRGEL